MSNHRKRPANKLEIEDEPEVKITKTGNPEVIEKKTNEQPPARFCDPEQVAKKSKVEVDSSKETEVDLSKEKEVNLPKEKEVDSFQKKRNLKRHIGEVHEGKKPFVEKKKIDQKSMTSSPNEDETPNAGMIAQT